ncbi:MAG: hypothetical protein ABL995_17545 [Bryobacteraceae bacterium]
MDQQTLLTLFVGIAAIAMVLQLATLFGIYRSTQSMNDKVQRLLPRVENLIETSRRTVEDSRVQILDITSKTSDILDTARKQLEKVEEVIDDATARARVHMDRAEMVLDDAMTRTQQTVATVNNGIVKPVREIQGVAAGLRTAILFLTKGRPNPTQATSDEEMFI